MNFLPRKQLLQAQELPMHPAALDRFNPADLEPFSLFAGHIYRFIIVKHADRLGVRARFPHDHSICSADGAPDLFSFITYSTGPPGAVFSIRQGPAQSGIFRTALHPLTDFFPV